jgi:hypothetical protein
MAGLATVPAWEVLPKAALSTAENFVVSEAGDPPPSQSASGSVLFPGACHALPGEECLDEELVVRGNW